MTSPLATAFVVAIYIAAVAPIGVAVAQRGSGRFIGLLYGVAILALGFYHIGIVQRGGLAAYDIRDLERSAREAGEGGECAEILRLLDRAGAIVDRRDPARLIVVGRVWDQLPAPVRDAAINCVERSRPEAARGRPLEVLPR